MAVVNADTGLAKVVVVGPKRQLEVALPEQLPVAALLPTLLRQGGDELLSSADAAGGWLLCRTDGSTVDAGRTLAAQHVRDGEILHLVPRTAHWPQIQYDDVVDAIAAGARRGGPAWSAAATRAAGLSGAVAALFTVLVVVLVTGERWALPGAALLVLSAGLVATGAVLARAFGDAVAGAVVAAAGMPYALVGGAVVLGGSLSLGELGAPHLLLGSAALLLAAVLGQVGVADLRSLFVAGMTAGGGGVIGAVLAMTVTSPVGAVAVVVTSYLVLSPGLPLLSVRAAKVPMPQVPRDADDLRAGDAMPPLQQVMDQVSRSLDLLTGGLLGGALITAVGCAWLAASGSASGLLLAAVVSVTHLLRSRMLVAVRQRTPAFVGGAVGLAATGVGVAVAAPDWMRFGVVVPLLLLCGSAGVVAARLFASRGVSPRLGRLADILDVTLTLLAGPVAASVLGLYSVMRGLNG